MSARVELRCPSVDDLVMMAPGERLAVLADVDAAGEALATLRGALRALLHEPPAPAALLEAKEAARRLGVSVDYVRSHGAALDIEVWLDGVVRYDPARVEAARRRRRPRRERAGEPRSEIA